MSEVPGEAEVEAFFNEEIFGAPAAVENPPPFPDSEPEAPESKPITEIEEAPQEEAPPPEEPEAQPDTEEPQPQEEAPEEEEPQEEEHLAWARKQYGEALDLANPDVQLLARAAFEKEKMLGKKAEESKREREERERLEVQQRIDALNTPGSLTPDEENWVNEAMLSNDPGEWAYAALQGERPDLYATLMDRWSSLGETESRRARVLHSRVVQIVTQPQPSETESYALALGQTFASLGLSVEQHGPLILQKAEELGTAHPAVQGMMSQDSDVRRISARAIFDLVNAGNATVHKAKANDVVEARVQEEKLRQNAAGIQTGGPRVEDAPKKSPFWEQFDTELEERGWDGNRPTYGRGE